MLGWKLADLFDKTILAMRNCEAAAAEAMEKNYDFKDNYDKERIRRCGMRLDPFSLIQVSELKTAKEQLTNMVPYRALAGFFGIPK